MTNGCIFRRYEQYPRSRKVPQRFESETQGSQKGAFKFLIAKVINGATLYSTDYNTGMETTPRAFQGQLNDTAIAECSKNGIYRVLDHHQGAHPLVLITIITAPLTEL